MANLDEPNGTAGASDDQSTPPEKLSRLALEARVRELEKETVRLKAELSESRAKQARDRDLIDSLIREDLPRDEAEFKEWNANSTSFSELLRGLEKEFGLEPPK